MIHKKSKSKGQLSPKKKLKKCQFCENQGIKLVDEAQFLQLNKKYLLNDVKAGMSCKFDNFVLGKLKRFPGGINEFQKSYNQIGTLKKLYSWNQVLENITSVIRGRSSIDRYEVMHFSSKYYEMLVRYYQKKRNISHMKMKSKGSEDVGKSTQAGDIKLLKNSISQKKNLQLITFNKIVEKNDSFVEMEKLTKSIEKMYYTFRNKKVLSSLNQEFKQKKHEKNHQMHQKQLLNQFQKQIDGKISLIKEKSKSKKKKRKQKTLGNEEDLYGLKKSNVTDKYQPYNVKRVVTETVVDKIKSKTPKSRGFYSPDQYFCTQKISNINSQKIKKKPTKKNIDSKSFKGKVKSRSRSKETYQISSKLTKVISHHKIK